MFFLQTTSSAFSRSTLSLRLLSVFLVAEASISPQLAQSAELEPSPKKKPPEFIAQPETSSSRNYFHCERRFLYQGKQYGCDSNIQRDAEHLRPLFSQVPSAVAELDTYQGNRQNVRTAAYVGSVGLLVALGGLLVSRSFTDSNGNLTSTGNQLRNLTLLGGLGITGVSVVYGLSILHNNESHLDTAVKNFNQARPNTPIVLELSTGFNL